MIGIEDGENSPKKGHVLGLSLTHFVKGKYSYESKESILKGNLKLKLRTQPRILRFGKEPTLHPKTYNLNLEPFP